MKQLIFLAALSAILLAGIVTWLSPPATPPGPSQAPPVVEVRLSPGAEVVMDVAPGYATIAPAPGAYSGRYNAAPSASATSPIMASPVHFQAQGPPATLVQNTTTGEITIEPTPQKGSSVVEWFRWLWDNWENFAAVALALIMAIEPIVRWTPTERDNNLLRTISSWLDRVIPNRRRGGGTFTAYRNPDETPPLAAPPPPVQRE